MLDKFLKKPIRDKVSAFSSPSKLRTPIFKVMSANQTEDSEVQVIAPAVFLYLLTEELEMSLPELMERAERIVKDADHIYSPHMKAAREYIRKELK